MKLMKFALATGLMLSVGMLALPNEAEAGRRGHFSLHVPGFSLYIGKHRSYRPYYRKRHYGRHYRKPYYYEKRRHYRKHRHRGHHPRYHDNQGGL